MNNERISIKKHDLQVLLFWAHVGTASSISGSYGKEIPKLIVHFMKKLNLKPSSFCQFDNPEFKKLAYDVYNEWVKNQRYD